MKMRSEIPPGISFTIFHQVVPDDTASRYGSGSIEVYATPAMISLMERVAMESVRPYLEDGEATVGTMVNVRHLKATPVGGNIKCTSVLKESEGRRLLFEVAAWDDTGIVGTGMHERYIINEERFLKKIEI